MFLPSIKFDNGLKFWSEKRKQNIGDNENENEWINENDTRTSAKGRSATIVKKSQFKHNSKYFLLFRIRIDMRMILYL